MLSDSLSGNIEHGSFFSSAGMYEKHYKNLIIIRHWIKPPSSETELKFDKNYKQTWDVTWKNLSYHKEQ